jgi:SAM-dependent methyltransferase
MMKQDICGMNVDVVRSDYVDQRATPDGVARVNKLILEWTAKGTRHYGNKSGPFEKRGHGYNYQDPAFLREHPDVQRLFDEAEQQLNKWRSEVSPAVAGLYPSNKRLREGLARFDLLNAGTTDLLMYAPRGILWFQYLPTALALYALMRQGIRPGVADDEESRVLLDNAEIARGVRARADYFRRTMIAAASKSGGAARITSLACGEAYAEMDVVTAKRCVMTLLDINPEALNHVRTVKGYAGVQKDVLVASRNVLARGGLDVAAAKVLGAILARKHSHLINFASIGRGSQDLVGAIGLAEYLPLDNWKKAIFAMAGLRQFLRNAYELVAPGGKLLVGFMLYDKWGEGGELNPHILFVTDVLQWGGLRPRKIEEMVQAFVESGVDKESIRDIRVVVMPEGLYGLLEVTKAG